MHSVLFFNLAPLTRGYELAINLNCSVIRCLVDVVVFVINHYSLHLLECSTKDLALMAEGVSHQVL